MNPFFYSDNNKRYHTLAYENARRGVKTQKAVLNAGFTCPNIDGSVGTGGCVFCDGSGGYFTASSEVDITSQMDAEILRIREKHPDAEIIAYFQSNTNTYAPVDILRERYCEALRNPEVSGIAIATRADCLPDEVVELLKEVNIKAELTVELGLQTANDDTARRINRGYSFMRFVEGYNKLKAAGIRVTVHIIDGLPSECLDDMLHTARVLGRLRPDGVKIHLCHVIEGTALHRLYEAGEYTPMEFDGYVDAVVRQLELLPAETVIERITGDGDRRTLIAPLWSRDKIHVLGEIDRQQAKRGTWQGRLFKEKT